MRLREVDGQDRLDFVVRRQPEIVVRAAKAGRCSCLVAVVRVDQRV